MRKTNLFYLDGNSSNFLTFSNYGEYLTGVSLSTNHKIYPSSFMCLNLPFDNEHTLENFKNFLMCYYENKLAYIRDDYEKNDKLTENVMSLSYLLESIYLFFDKEIPSITYFGDIVEHDYNGSYSDSICIVDFKRLRKVSEIKPSENYTDDNIESMSYVSDTDESYVLNGWYNENLGIYPIYLNINQNSDEYDTHIIKISEDEQKEVYTRKYEEDSLFDYLTIVRDEISTKIEFNCIISLFDVNDLNYQENNKIITDDFVDGEIIDGTTSIILNNRYKDEDNDNIRYDSQKYIPYGIWFASKKTENGNELNNITLYKDSDNIAQKWSLVISSKFSPYPYGVKISDTAATQDISKYTYMELLAYQSELLEKYNEMIINISNLSIEFEKLKNMYKAITTLDIDKIKLDTSMMIADFKNEMMLKFKEIDDRFAQFTWEKLDRYPTNNN